MFSGIVETIGKILQIELINGCKQFTIAPNIKLDDLHIGDSIAINGVCLTITEFTSTNFKVTAVPETLRLTNLDQLIEQQPVNIERSLLPTTRLGGHFVQGHVDGTGKILAITSDHSDAWLVKIGLADSLMIYLVNKGFVTIDGMSITIIHVSSDYFTVTLIPHTQAVTIANQYNVGNLVNIEVDMMAKYIEKFSGAFHHAKN